MVDSIPTTNPAGTSVPPAMTEGAKGNLCFELLGKDNCDSNPQLYIKDSLSVFVAGPFRNGDKVKITRTGGAPNQKPMDGEVVARIQIKGNALLYGVDSAGNKSPFQLCH